MWYVFEGTLEPWTPKPIPKFKTLNVEYFFWYLWQVFCDLGQTKAPVGNVRQSSPIGHQSYRDSWILSQQPKTGLLQLRFPDAPFPDILHSYFSVCGLCLCGLLPPLDAMLGMSQASRQAAEDRGVLPPWKVKEKDAGKWEEMIRNCSKWSTNLLKELRPLDSNYILYCVMFGKLRIESAISIWYEYCCVSFWTMDDGRWSEVCPK